MTTYDFKCTKCGTLIEKFRLGNDKYQRWKDGKEIITCECGCKSIERVYPKGSVSKGRVNGITHNG